MSLYFLPNGCNELIAPPYAPLGFYLRDEIGCIVSPVTKQLEIGERVAQRSGIAPTSVDQLSRKCRPDKSVRPLIALCRDAISQHRRNRRLEAGVIATIGAAIVATMFKFALGGPEAFDCFGKVDPRVFIHVRQSINSRVGASDSDRAVLARAV